MGTGKKWNNRPWPCVLGISRRPEQFEYEGGPAPEKIPPSRDPAHQHRPTGVTVDRRLRLCRCCVVRETSVRGLGQQWLEQFRAGYGGLRRVGSWGKNTAAVGGEHI
jgi:hypothetical protein